MDSLVFKTTLEDKRIWNHANCLSWPLSVGSWWNLWLEKFVWRCARIWGFHSAFEKNTHLTWMRCVAHKSSAVMTHNMWKKFYLRFTMCNSTQLLQNWAATDNRSASRNICHVFVVRSCWQNAHLCHNHYLQCHVLHICCCAQDSVLCCAGDKESFTLRLFWRDMDSCKDLSPPCKSIDPRALHKLLPKSTFCFSFF